MRKDITIEKMKLGGEKVNQLEDMVVVGKQQIEDLI